MDKQNNFKAIILTDQPAAAVFNAVNNVRGWWQGEIKGDTEKLNDEFTYQMKPYHFSRQKVIESSPNKKVVWLITESQINFVEDKEEWLDTKIIFDISTEDENTKLTFTHQGLVPSIECYQNCAGAWDSLIKKSLFNFITTGKGVAVF